MKISQLLATIGAIFFAAVAYADGTISQVVTRTHYNESANVAYVVGSGKWSGTSCPNATYVTINPVSGNPGGVGQMLSIILAAQFAGKGVSFIGSCDANPDYFIAFYVTVQ
jgi:hypothetical protein